MMLNQNRNKVLRPAWWGAKHNVKKKRKLACQEDTLW